MEENIIPKRALCMNLGITRLRGRPRNRWQMKLERMEEQLVEKGGKKKVHNREGWKKLLRTARNRRILHTPME
jgi:hypothetical protein